jgi:outer membrane protein OmpA-like peptidoglycan-associated protein
MRLSARLIATAAFAIFLMPAFLLRAAEAAKTSAGDEKAVDSSTVSAAEPFAFLPSAPRPAAMMAAAMPYAAGLNMGTPKVELFLGYSYVRAVPTLAYGNRLVWMNGGSASIAYNFNRYWGIVADVGDYTNSKIQFTGAYGATIDVDQAKGGVLSYLFGPRLSFRQHERFTPFVQALFGGVHASEVDIANCTFSCTLLPEENVFALTAGGGLDIKIHRHFAIRLIQAEYLMTRFQNYDTGTSAMQNDMRLSSGIVFRFGGSTAPPLPPLPPLAYSCSVNPTAAFMGDTIAASGTAVNLNPAKTPVYTWSVDGGVVTGVESTAKIDTTNLAPGAYTLKGHVSEGDRPGENADCTAQYVVKAFEPPTVSCVANPSSVISGDSSTITATGVSPENRPLTYSYSSTSGSVSGSGTTATLSTVGATLGTVTVTCNAVDDKGQTASGTTAVEVSVPAVASKPMTSNLCSIQFGRDSQRPTRVDNEAKACLDEIALDLQRSSDATIAIVGNAAAGEKGAKKLAAERAVNTKTYLVSEKGIDSSRITVYSGSQDEKTASTTLIPAGATFDTTGDTPVD